MVVPVVAAGATAGARAVGTRAATSAAAGASEQAARARLTRELQLRAQLQAAQRVDNDEEEEENEQESSEPKISSVMVVLGSLWYGIIDLIGIILAFVGLDDFFILDLLAWPMHWYLRHVGAPSTYDLIGQIVEMIPYVGALPLRSICWGITVWVDRNPDGTTSQIVNRAEQATSRVNQVSSKTNLAA